MKSRGLSCRRPGGGLRSWGRGRLFPDVRPQVLLKDCPLPGREKGHLDLESQGRTLGLAALSRPFHWHTRFGPYKWHACASGHSCVMGQTRVLPVALRGCGAWEEARVWTRPGDGEVT